MLLRLGGVRVAYGDGEPVLSLASLELCRGDAVLLIGPSGCGKSTLALLAAGLIPGVVEATVQGEVWRAPALERPGGVGYVFQDPEAQLCQLTLGREVAFGLENMRVPAAEMPARIEAALRAADLGVDPGEFDTVLSGGMKQKLAIASAFALRPEILVLDEPTANLDPQATAAIFRQIAWLRRQGQTLLVIEHRFTGLLAALGRVVALGPDGRQVFSGPLPQAMAEHWGEVQALGVVPTWQRSPLTQLPTLAPAPAPAMPSGGRAAFAAEELGYTYQSGPVRRRLAQRGETPRYALRGIGFSILTGGITAIVGPNGSGKSTLLRILAGFEAPNEGNLRRPSAQGAIAFAFQNPEHQFVYQTVAEELLSRYIGEGPVPADVLRLLAEFGLAGHERQSPFALSQGQKRRLSVAAMLLQDHAAYLLDEPTFGQDARTQETIMKRLLHLQEAGRTIVLTTHDMDLVQRYATQVLVLSEGRLLFSGRPAELFAQPELMRQAHLMPEESGDTAAQAAKALQAGGARFVRIAPLQALSPVGRLHPALKLFATLLAMGVLVFTVNVRQGLYLTLLPLLLLFLGAHLTLRQVAARILPFVAFFALYTWTLTAYAQVPPGSPSVHFLVFRLSLAGLMIGLSLGMRMLATVTFAVLFVSTTDITDLLVSLTENFRVPPKLTYGTLAGLSFFPLFEDEWAKLRRARALRPGMRPSPLGRVVTYALPLLAQAIRLGERVAIAMQARGFRGPALERADGRTYYRWLPVRLQDVLYVVALTASCLILLRLGR